MNALLVVPHGDVSLEISSEGWRTVDANRAFWSACLDRGVLRHEVERCDAELTREPSAERLRALLRLRAGASLLDRRSGELHCHLRAGGAVLSARSADTGVRLTLDDIELSHGTTESLADVLDCVRQRELPYLKALEQAVQACAGADVVRLWLQRDQQLPAVLWVARQLAGRQVELAGEFAIAHRSVLSRCAALAGVTFVDEPARMRQQVVGPPTLPLSAELRIDWRSELGHRAGPPWGGRVALGDLLEPQRLIDAGARTLVADFCALTSEHWLASDGSTIDRLRLADGVRRLRARGGRVLLEWWIGAPGVTAEALEASADSLESSLESGIELAGLRRFHWPARRGSARWHDVDVNVADPDPRRDLARTRPFAAPDTLSAREAEEAIGALVPRLQSRYGLCSGRLAAAYHVPPEGPRSAARRSVQLDPDCAVVRLPHPIEGNASGACWYAANLRTGRVIKIDRRLVSALTELQEPADTRRAFSAIPERQRDRLRASLVERGVLREGEP